MKKPMESSSAEGSKRCTNRLSAAVSRPSMPSCHEMGSLCEDADDDLLGDGGGPLQGWRPPSGNTCPAAVPAGMQTRQSSAACRTGVAEIELVLPRRWRGMLTLVTRPTSPTRGSAATSLRQSKLSSAKRTLHSFSPDSSPRGSPEAHPVFGRNPTASTRAQTWVDAAGRVN